jgi:hypothetical protein
MTDFQFSEERNTEFDNKRPSPDRQLLEFMALAGVGPAGVAAQFWAHGHSGLHVSGFFLSALGGVIGAVIFCRFEGLPIRPALVPSVICATGAYLLSVWYCTGRQQIKVLEFLIPAIIGAGPGMIVFLLFMRWHNSRIAKDEHRD